MNPFEELVFTVKFNPHDDQPGRGWFALVNQTDFTKYEYMTYSEKSPELAIRSAMDEMERRASRKLWAGEEL